ncbi:putative FBD-associated F-box protein At1g78730 [Hevea brasiliensis]|uniref:putative FBD-associated F-box protein At1g78730 n=1 Tax=Hevea brasiliensis TaxID=3981 RepID=UPI0025F7EC06|nr:putative FBD-associated F-box protein At1g78730 [Hevea brasiliensis]
MDKRIEAVDYISELPEHILHHILSFLPIKQITRTSALSKTWFQVWKTSPILEFNFYALFSGNRDRYYCQDFEIRERNIQELYNFVEQILLSRCKHMDNLIKFTLVVTFIYERPEMVSTMDKWIGYALKSNVKHLKIQVGPSNDDETYKYCVPQIVLNAISIQVLDLSHCKLHLPFIGNMKLPFLKKLSLRVVFADDDVISKLIAGFPLIEYMSFITCYGIKSLQIFDLVNLIQFCAKDIVHFERLKMETPNLHSFTLQGPTWPSVLKLASLKNLKSLHIFNAPITDKWLYEQLNKFPHIECLSLADCPMLESIKISSSSLHKLRIDSCGNMAKLHIDIRNLYVFSYYSDIISFSSNNLTLPKVNLYIKSNNMDNSWYTRLIRLLDEFNQCFKMVTLESDTGENYIIPCELRKLTPPPSHNMKELKLSMNTNHHRQIAKLVDAMLWISPHLESLHIINFNVQSSFKFSYQKQIYEECICYKSTPISCWKNCIKQVKIKQNFPAVTRREDECFMQVREREERNFAFSQDIWEKISDFC